MTQFSGGGGTYKIEVDSSGTVKFYKGSSLITTSSNTASGDYYMMVAPYQYNGVSTFTYTWSGTGVGEGFEVLDSSTNTVPITATGTSVSGTIGNAIASPNLSYSNANLPSGTAPFSVGGWVGLNSFNPTLTHEDDLSSSTGLTVTSPHSISGGVLEYTTTGGIATYDLGTALDNTQWVMRYKHTPTTITLPSGNWAQAGFGLSDNTSGFTSAQDFIGINTLVTSGGFIRTSMPDGGSIDSTLGTGFQTTMVVNTPYYIEITRLSATQWKAELFSDANYSNSIESITNSVSSGVQNLQYIKSAYRGIAGNLVAEVDDIKIWDGVLSAPIPPTDTKLLNINDVTFTVGTTSASVDEATSSETLIAQYDNTVSGWSGYLYTNEMQTPPSIGTEITHLKIHTGTGSANVQLAIYSDNGGRPATKLAETASEAISGSGFHELELTTPYTVTGSSALHFGMLVSDNSLELSYNTGSGITGVKDAYVTSSFPNSLTGVTNQNYNQPNPMDIRAVSNSNNNIITATTTDNTSTPKHYAFTRSGNSWAIYQDGVSKATATDVTSLGAYTSGGLSTADVTWGTVSGVTDNGLGKFTKSGTDAWGAGAITAETIDTGDSFTASTSSTHWLFGIDSSTSTAQWANLFAVHPTWSSTLDIYDRTSGTLVNTIPSQTWSSSTVFDLKINSSNYVEVYVDGVLKYTSTDPISSAMYGRAYAYNSGQTQMDITDFTASTDYTTTIDGTLDEYFINSDALTATEISKIEQRGDAQSPVTTTATSFNDNTVVAGNEYYYKIYGVNDIGSSLPSNIDGAMTVSPANAPTSLTASVNSNAQIVLDWVPSTDLGNGSLISMNLQRDDGS